MKKKNKKTKFSEQRDDDDDVMYVACLLFVRLFAVYLFSLCRFLLALRDSSVVK